MTRCPGSGVSFPNIIRTATPGRRARWRAGTCGRWGAAAARQCSNCSRHVQKYCSSTPARGSAWWRAQPAARGGAAARADVAPKCRWCVAAETRAQSAHGPLLPSPGLSGLKHVRQHHAAHEAWRKRPERVREKWGAPPEHPELGTVFTRPRTLATGTKNWRISSTRLAGMARRVRIFRCA